MTEPQAERKTATMYPREWRIVERLGKDMGSGTSAALRRIANERSRQGHARRQRTMVDSRG